VLQEQPRACSSHRFRKSSGTFSAVLRIARELPRWQWTWLFHFIPRVIRDAIYDLVARNRYRWFGRRDACILPNLDRSWPS
jgi:predicted DCC family thiol-disulfide oxidoreductase YuxK